MSIQEVQQTRIDHTLAGLRNRGYQFRFRRESTCIYCLELQERVMPEDFTVDQSFYFEDMTSPDADRILYAISLSGGGKGFLVDVCTVYADNISHEMSEKLGWQYPVPAWHYPKKDHYAKV